MDGKTNTNQALSHLLRFLENLPRGTSESWAFLLALTAMEVAR